MDYNSVPPAQGPCPLTGFLLAQSLSSQSRMPCPLGFFNQPVLSVSWVVNTESMWAKGPPRTGYPVPCLISPPSILLIQFHLPLPPESKHLAVPLHGSLHPYICIIFSSLSSVGSNLPSFRKSNSHHPFGNGGLKPL